MSGVLRTFFVPSSALKNTKMRNKSPFYFTLLALIGVCVGIPNVTVLGAFDFQMAESSPLVWNGRLVVMETIPYSNPQHQGTYIAYNIELIVAAQNVIKLSTATYPRFILQASATRITSLYEIC